MTWRITHVYPFLFALIPVLRLVAEHPGWAEWADVSVILAAVLVACGAVYGLALLATRRWRGRFAPLLLMGVVVAFWGYVRVALLAEHRAGLSHPVLVPLWTAATVGAIWVLVRRPALLERAETFLTLSGGMLVGWYLVSIGVGELRSARAIRESALVRRLSEPVRAPPDARTGPKRDIYLIVLDEYASPEVTARLFGFDNRAFVDSLRRLGFIVPAVHSNYLHTFLSLPSLLNASHLTGLADEVGRESLDRTLPDHLFEHNRTVPFLKAHSYKFVFFPSLAWEATKDNPQADLEVRLWSGLNPAREVSRSGLRQVLNETSLLKYVDWGGRRLVRDHVRGTLAAITRVPEIPGPVFAFAHVMSPHGPYVFDRNCRPADRKRVAGRPRRQGTSYVAQIECLNRMVLDLVTTLLRTSERPPVILLQGDHGSKMLLFDRAPSAESITLAAAKERLGTFGAYYLPDGGSQAFGDSVTIVNVMGNVLRHYLGADLPPESDDMYLSVDATPYAFKRVDFPWLARENWSDGVGSQAAGERSSGPPAGSW